MRQRNMFGRKLHERPEFQEFFSAYPRRVNKGTARKAFEWALTVATQEEIMDGLARQKAKWVGERREEYMIPYPATWLNAEGWENVSEEEVASIGEDSIDAILKRVSQNEHSH